MKCIIILSSKSSGSSACQNLLSKFADIRHVTTTRHFQNETLYWTKAASILGLPQRKMLDSEVPITPKRAKSDLIALLRDNLDSYTPPKDERDLIFEGWHLLCKKYAPIFLEKSPHHLHQWSALELIVECMEILTDIDFLLVGLVRNPMDTLYSAFGRQKTPPEKNQTEWLIAYRNLLKLRNLVGDELVTVRYEDMVSSLSHLSPVFEFCEVKVEQADQGYLHKESIAKWKEDRRYGFTLSEEVIDLARMYGYKRQELANQSYLLWPVYRDLSRGLYRALEPGRKPLRRIKRQLMNRF
jgi:hypothetical protein